MKKPYTNNQFAVTFTLHTCNKVTTKYALKLVKEAMGVCAKHLAEHATDIVVAAPSAKPTY